jgi:multiple sugar transport system ATP-binding protein
MASITFEGVTKVFGDGTVAVRDLDLVVEEGELFVLLGSSGSGKTTALRLVAGLERPTEGRVLLDEDDVTDLAPPKRDVAMVFQHLALYPHMSVRANIAFGIESHRLPKAEVEDRVRRVVAMLGLEDVVTKGPGSLSGGQAQRVALGRAIVREPRAFLMDEPLSSLDERLRIELRGEVARIQREVASTMLYVTHDQSEALALGDRVGVLREGALEGVRTPRQLYERPDNLFVAGFVGTPPMNLAEATLDRDESGAYALLFGGHRVVLDDETVRRRPRLAEFVRRQVAVGVRPEHLRDADDAAPAGARMRVTIDRVEPIEGRHATWFLLDAPLLLAEDPDGEGGGSVATGLDRANVWIARVSRTIVPGDVVELVADAGSWHLFDPRTGDPIED